MSFCQHCGNCAIAELHDLCNEMGIHGHLATGGREAIKALKSPTIRAVVAIACKKELFDGILASLPKPVLAVYNQLPNGPCHNTCVKVDEVRAAMQELLKV